MSYRIELTDNFKQEARTLIKKYVSLRKEIVEMGRELAENPTKGVSLGNMFTKYVLLLLLKIKENLAVPELSLL